jgi:hypothetical protein
MWDVHCDVFGRPGVLEETRFETWFREMGLKIRPDVFCHDNCERI